MDQSLAGFTHESVWYEAITLDTNQFVKNKESPAPEEDPLAKLGRMLIL
jgi:hypothetical protein